MCQVFFPTCQVRVVRLYKSCSPSSPAGPQQGASDRTRQRRTSTRSVRSQWAAPDLNKECQIADCSGQRRTSTGSSRLQWAALGLTRGVPERSGQRRTSPGELPSGVGSAGPHQPEDMSKDLSEICQTRMSEDMSKDMSIEMSDMKKCQKRTSERMSEDMSEDMSIETVKKEMSNKRTSEKNV